MYSNACLSGCIFYFETFKPKVFPLLHSLHFNEHVSNSPVGGRISEAYSHPVDMNNVNIKYVIKIFFTLVSSYIAEQLLVNSNCIEISFRCFRWIHYLRRKDRSG